MAEERGGAWFGFGFCGFGQALGSGCGSQSVASPEPLLAGVDVRRVSAGWSYTALVTRGGRVHLSGAARGEAGGCRDAWASERLLVLLRAGPGRGQGQEQGRGAELQAWAPGSALRGEPLWTQSLEPEAGAGAGALPLLPGARAFASPQPPWRRPLCPELRARRLELGAEHALLLAASGQVFSWGGGRHGQLGHGTLEAELEPRPLEALQGLPMAEVAAGGWHSVCVSDTGDIYVWGWNESGQLALPTRSLAEDGHTVTGEGRVNLTSTATSWGIPLAGEPQCSGNVRHPSPQGTPRDPEALRGRAGTRWMSVWHRTACERELQRLVWNGLGSAGRLECSRACKVELGVRYLLLRPPKATGRSEDGSAGAEDVPVIAVQPFPALLDLPGGAEAAKASCGSRHTAVVTRTGELFTWGWGKYGQLGHRDTTSWDRPRLVGYFADKRLHVKTVTCGPWNTYVYAMERGES